MCAALLPALGASRAHADGHSVAVTSPAPATLTAELHTPRGSGPFAPVILMHGCGGIRPNNPRAHEGAEKQVRAFLAAQLGK